MIEVLEGNYSLSVYNLLMEKLWLISHSHMNCGVATCQIQLIVIRHLIDFKILFLIDTFI